MPKSLSRDVMFDPRRDVMFYPLMRREVLPKGSGMGRICSSFGWNPLQEILPGLVPSRPRSVWTSFADTSRVSLASEATELRLSHDTVRPLWRAFRNHGEDG
jgi:hypothetical protein